MVEYYLQQASSYAAQIDNVILVIAIITGIWSVLCFGVFFWFLYKFRAKDGVGAQYVTGDVKEEKKYVTWPHNLVLLCDIGIIVIARNAWNPSSCWDMW